ncbi:MAG: glycosyltransferase family 4 protein [Bacteroidetes bacterium]|uniref:Glycosyltransferase family 4 protein n=1 Tax=Candidatus Cryptobacteroides merdavium TaxID=2840769 RepID=A0A9D9EAZ9_9BACT|nr:glycosyltransferase family 4 protein [Candidatus Cryptobacteroides merdavium]
MGRKMKIAFVSVRYGLEINGGAELHCRMLAERLAGRHEVEVLTTCVKDYTKGTNEFPAGTVTINNVTVRRFVADPFVPENERYWLDRAKAARRLRMHLYQTGILRAVSYLIKVWKWKLADDIEAQRSAVFHSHRLLEYISGHKNEYDAFIVFSSNFPLFYFTAMEAGEKTLAIPLLHRIKPSFRVSLSQAFNNIRYVGFNTGSEQRLAEGIFGRGIHESGVIGAGIETHMPAGWEDVSKKYGLPEQYILFIGRIDRDKTGKMAEYYGAYRKRYGDKALPLVVIGNVYEKEPATGGLIYTGFVSEGEKRAILQHARLLLNPSKYESLSLVLLEALYDNIPALVNGHCSVFREHRKKSGGAVQCYMGKKDFIYKLHAVATDAALRKSMMEKGKEYVDRNYSWDIIMSRLDNALMKVIG